MDIKTILDACCGSRMFWFDKENPNVVFADIRHEDHILCDGRLLQVHPDLQIDYTKMPFDSSSFKLVVFDPPHMFRMNKNAYMAQKYGVLPRNWEENLKEGFDECMRVLEPYGLLIFKWNEAQITLSRVKKAIGGIEPLIGHTTGRHGKTIWMVYIKLPQLNGANATEA